MKSKLSALLMVLLGAAGLLLQIWSRRTSYDRLNLPIPGAPALTVLRVFVAAVLVVSLLIAFLVRDEGGEEHLYENCPFLLRVTGVLAAAVTCVGGIYRLLGGGLLSGSGRSPIVVINAVISLLLLAGGIAMFRLVLPLDGRTAVHPLAALLPGFAGCFWLVMFYHAHSQDPAVAHYGWTLLCLMASILALYLQAACSFDHPHPKAALLFSLTAGVLSLTALPCAESASEFLLLLGLAFWMLTHCYLLPKLSRTPAAQSQPGTQGRRMAH